MKEIERLFTNNRAWSEAMRETDPEYFARRAQGQSPMFFFIGCCDSRVPTEVMTGAHPGEIFTLRNVANQAALTDLSFLTALEYAIEFLDVKHVVVCGHYKCGGVLASLGGLDHGIVDHWLSGVRDVIRIHKDELDALPEEERGRRLVQLNVLEQVYNLSRTPVVQRAWSRGRRPILTGLVYDLENGLIDPLVTEVSSLEDANTMLPHAIDDSGGVPQRQRATEQVLAAAGRK
jgi:carbonic anhydrase